MLSDLSSLKVSKDRDACWRLQQSHKCPVLLVPENSRGGPGACSSGKVLKIGLLKSLEMYCRVRDVGFLILPFKRAHVIMVSLR